MKTRLFACLFAWVFSYVGWAEGQPRSHTAPIYPKPSLNGVWAANFVLSMEATPQAPNLVVSEQEAKRVAALAAAAMSDFFAKTLDPEVPEAMQHIDGLPFVRGQRRTRVVILPADGMLPYTPAARQELAAPPPGKKLDNPEQRPNSERCLVGNGQPPLSSFVFLNPLQIVQTPGEVVLHTEYGDDMRIVHITDKHAPKALWSRLGDSIGHWEGATLVIETVGLPDADHVHRAPFLLVPSEGKVIERITPISNRELLYQFTVVDPNTYSAPWLGEFSWFRTEKAIYESACHEGNYSLPNILSGARYEEAVAKAAAAR